MHVPDGSGERATRAHEPLAIAGAETRPATPAHWPYDDDAVWHLTVQVLREALRVEGPAYIASPCARLWITAINLDPEVVWAEAVRGTPIAGGWYRPTFRCNTCGRAWRL